MELFAQRGAKRGRGASRRSWLVNSISACGPKESIAVRGGKHADTGVWLAKRTKKKNSIEKKGPKKEKHEWERERERERERNVSGYKNEMLLPWFHWSAQVWARQRKRTKRKKNQDGRGKERPRDGWIIIKKEKERERERERKLLIGCRWTVDQSGGDGGACGSGLSEGHRQGTNQNEAICIDRCNAIPSPFNTDSITSGNRIRSNLPWSWK